MSESQSNGRTDDLGDLFVSVTGADTVTERQDADDGERAVAEGEAFEGIEDGLDDAVEGGEARFDMGTE